MANGGGHLRSTLAFHSGNTQLTFPVLFSKFWDLRASSRQPNFRLRFLSRGCASTNDVCKLRIHVFKTTNGQEQNYESIRPNYEKVLDCSRSHISKLRIRISRPRTEIFRLRLEVLNLKFSDYERTKNSATKPKFAWAKNNHKTTELAGVQYAACHVANFRAVLLGAPFQLSLAGIFIWRCLQRKVRENHTSSLSVIENCSPYLLKGLDWLSLSSSLSLSHLIHSWTISQADIDAQLPDHAMLAAWITITVSIAKKPDFRFLKTFASANISLHSFLQWLVPDALSGPNGPKPPRCAMWVMWQTPKSHDEKTWFTSNSKTHGVIFKVHKTCGWALRAMGNVCNSDSCCGLLSVFCTTFFVKNFLVLVQIFFAQKIFAANPLAKIAGVVCACAINFQGSKGKRMMSPTKP